MSVPRGKLFPNIVAFAIAVFDLGMASLHIIIQYAIFTILFTWLFHFRLFEIITPNIFTSSASASG